jgi:hypothetical protein
MPHRSSRSRRYAGRALVLSVLGWALFSRDREEEALEPVTARPFDLDTGHDRTALELAEPSRPSRDERNRRRSPKRRLATSLAFATLFFAGAALSAGAGDMIAEAVEATGSTSTETTTTEAGDDALPAETPADEGVPAEEPPADEGVPGEEPPAETVPSDGDGTETTPDPGDADTGGDPAETPTETDPTDGSTPTVPSESDESDDGSSPAPGGDDDADGSGSGESGGSGDEPAPAGPPLIGDDTLVSVPVPPDPEAGEAAGGATIWLHRSLPDPTPSARRLTPAFARALRTTSARAGADWALVLGVLRADGNVGRTPAQRTQLRSLAAKLVKLGAQSDEWSAALALRGRTAFADRAVAAARLHRAVGLRALVTGLEAAKSHLERTTLGDGRISIYGGGRSDIAAHRIDIRVLVTLRYLAEAFGQVTVSSLQSGHRLYSRPGVVSAHVYGLAVDVAALGGVPIVGHQTPGSITEQAVRAVLLLPAGLQARQVISLIGLGGASFALADHDDHIHIGF